MGSNSSFYLLLFPFFPVFSRFPSLLGGGGSSISFGGAPSSPIISVFHRPLRRAGEDATNPGGHWQDGSAERDADGRGMRPELGTEHGAERGAAEPDAIRSIGKEGDDRPRPRWPTHLRTAGLGREGAWLRRGPRQSPETLEVKKRKNTLFTCTGNRRVQSFRWDPWAPDMQYQKTSQLDKNPLATALPNCKGSG